MEKSYKDLLLEILTVIDLKEKEKYAADMEELNIKESVLTCLQMLPLPMQEKIKSGKINPVEVVKTIPKELFEPVYYKISIGAFYTLLNQIDKALSQDQKNKIMEIIATN